MALNKFIRSPKIMMSSALDSFRPSGQLSCFDFFEIPSRRYPNPRITQTALIYDNAITSTLLLPSSLPLPRLCSFLLANILIKCHEALLQVRIVTFSPTYTVNALIDVRPFSSSRCSIGFIKVDASITNFHPIHLRVRFNTWPLALTPELGQQQTKTSLSHFSHLE